MTCFCGYNDLFLSDKQLYILKKFIIWFCRLNGFTSNETSTTEAELSQNLHDATPSPSPTVGDASVTMGDTATPSPNQNLLLLNV